jgi:hypothetical protein
MFITPTGPGSVTPTGTNDLWFRLINFDGGGAALKREHMTFLDGRVVPLLRFDESKQAWAQGSAGGAWPEANDSTLADQRAQAVVAYLTSQGVAAQQVKTSPSKRGSGQDAGERAVEVRIAAGAVTGVDPFGAPVHDDAAVQPTGAPRPWSEVVPDATSSTLQKSLASFTTPRGPLTNVALGANNQMLLTYAPGVTAAPLAAGVTTAQVDAALDAIRAARAQIRQRYLVLQHRPPKLRDPGALGFVATPDLDSNSGTPQTLMKGGLQAEAFKKADPSWMEIADASKGYLAWFQDTATKPSQVADAKDMVWRAFRRITDWEGMPTAVNTWDMMNVTLGAGFAASAGGQQTPGQAQQLMVDLCSRSALAKSMFSNAGLVLDGTDFVVVDPARKWKLRGTDAELYLRVNRDILSLYVNVAQGVFIDDKTQTTPQDELRRATLDANFHVFLKRTARGITSAQLGGDVDLAALKLHAPHSGSFTFGEVSGFGSLSDLIRYIYGKVGRNAAERVVPEEWHKLAPPP